MKAHAGIFLLTLALASAAPLLPRPALPGAAQLPHFVQLTRREREIVQLICDGQSNQEIADETGSSLATVKKHIHSIFRKLEVSSRSRLIALMR